MDAVTRGQAIRRARRRRGLSQTVLAGLVNRSESWLSQVERGKRDVDSHSVLTRLAEVLRVEISDLTGADPSDEATVRYSAAREIENAMTRYASLEAIIGELDDRHPIDVNRLRRQAGRVHAAYQATRYNDAGRRLPLLIRDVEAAARGRGSDRPAVCSVRAQVYSTTAALLRRVGERELAWTAADRAMSAAEWADEPLLAEVGAYRMAYVFVSRKRPTEAVDIAMNAAYALERRMRAGTPEELSVYGGLHLAAAVASAAEFNRPSVTRHLHQAQRAAERLGRNANLHGTAFGPANVLIHTLSTAVQMGDSKTAVDMWREYGSDYDYAACLLRHHNPVTDTTENGTMTTWTTRPETADDIPAVRGILLAAFPTAVEADIVDALRADPKAWIDGLSMVTTTPDGAPVGYALLSRCHVDGTPALALAPCAVAPSAQRTGAGSAAIRAALDAALAMGENLVLVLGHADYYPRFGFTPASRFGIRPPFEVPDEAMMAMALDGARPVPTGTIHYPAAFGV